MGDLFPILGQTVEASPRLTRESFGNIVVTVTVGPTKTPFKMHKDLLCSVSPYFKAVFEGGFKEAIDQVLELSNEDVTMFEHFQYWLYTNTMVEKDENLITLSWDPFIMLYVFGEARNIPNLQNAAIDVLTDIFVAAERFPMESVPFVWENTNAGSPLRRWFADIIATYVELHSEPNAPEELFRRISNKRLPKDFLVSLIHALYELKNGKTSPKSHILARRSHYHVKPAN